MENYRPYIAEALGTFALVFIGAGSICANYLLTGLAGNNPGVEFGIGVLGISIAFGLVVATMVYALGYISGCHINPAVTVAFWVTKRIEANKAIFYIGSQLAGAAAGGYLLGVLFPQAIAPIHLGVTYLGKGVTVSQGIAMEFIITFLLVLVIFATAIDQRAPRGFAGLAIGVVILFGVMVGWPITGGSMNPARTFGPAVASGFFQNHLVYWVGPVLGGIAAGLLYEKVFAEKK
jgi:glycerol uptake facilitator protein